jgi:hypothetical protein
MAEITVKQTFEIAIAAETTAKNLFQGLAAKFAPYAEIAAFWQGYMLPMKPNITCQEFGRFKANNLEDVYQLIDHVENRETNAIFQSLMNSFESNAQIRSFLREQLDQHVARLSTGLPVQYQSAKARRAVKTRELHTA